MFEEFYVSSWQHPILLWVAPALFLFLIPRGQGPENARFFSRYLGFFTVLTMLDPLITGPVLSALRPSSGVSDKVMILFVILGDLRFFAIVEHFSGPADQVGGSRRWLRALGWSLLVPVLQLGLIESLPELFSEVRYTFLAYEVLFFALALVFRFVILPRRTMTTQVRAWLNSVCQYVLVYYGLWATADLVILAGVDAGFGLRVIPNQLYYSFFLPFVCWTAPDILKLRKAATA